MEHTMANIRLKVQKMNTAAEFYRCIGFCIPEKVDNQLPLIIKSDDNALNLTLIPEDQIGEQPLEDYELIQIIYPNPTEVDRAYQQACCQGCISVSKPWNTFWGTRSAKIVDPDGHNILLYTNID